MTGEDEPANSLMNGFGRDVRRVLTKYGVSSEFAPRQVFHTSSGIDPLSKESLDDISGSWNLQADAALNHLMDFSDYYVLPESPLPAFWRMSEQSFCDAFTCERTKYVD